jgi:amino acid transporter
VVALSGLTLARRSVGTGGLWWFAVSASAPMTVLAGGVMATYAGTNVVGVPASFLLLGLVLWWLTVGWAAMSRHVPHPAPFYALLAHGLGRPWGLVGGTAALLAYNAIQISLYGLLGANLAATQGWLPWWGWAFLAWLVIGTCGLLRIDVGAGLVAVLLMFELGVIAAFVLGAIAHPADGGLTLGPFVPDRLFVDGVGGVLALGIAAFVGYESGPAYGEEARTDEAVRRASLLALAFLPLVYAASSWALAIAAGPERINASAAQDSALPFTLMSQWGVYGPILADMGAVLLVTSVLAAMLSFHNAVARYVFGLAREHALPATLAATGKGTRRDAPVGGSVLQSLVAALVVGLSAMIGLDPVTQLFTWLAAVAAIGVLALLLASAMAAIRWFSRGGGGSESAWQRWIAPVLGIGFGLVVLVTTVVNLDALLGVARGSLLTAVVPAAVLAAALFGLLWATWLRYRYPSAYARIGRGRPHPLEIPDARLREVSV